MRVTSSPEPETLQATTAKAEQKPGIRFPASLVTLVVPAGRGLGSLHALVASLRASARACDVEVLPPLSVGVGFAQPEQQAVELAATWREGGAALSLVRAAPTYATAVRNRVGLHVESEWIAFLDDDVVVHASYLAELFRLCGEAPSNAIQGNPYLCSNPDKLLARLEAANYADGFASYLHDADRVDLLDARNLLLRKDLLCRFPFNERLNFAGEGQELAERMRRHGVQPRYVPSLKVYHANRDSLWGLARQKFGHGRGRAQKLAGNGGIEADYLRRYLQRHYVEPTQSALRGRLSWLDAGYRLASNSVFWLGVGYEQWSGR